MILVIRVWFGVKIMYVLHGCTYNEWAVHIRTEFVIYKRVRLHYM